MSALSSSSKIDGRFTPKHKGGQASNTNPQCFLTCEIGQKGGDTFVVHTPWGEGVPVTLPDGLEPGDQYVATYHPSPDGDGSTVATTQRGDNPVRCFNYSRHPACEKTDRDGKLLRCSRCLCAVYCCKECQRADWKRVHKTKCKSMKGTSTKDFQSNAVMRRLDLHRRVESGTVQIVNVHSSDRRNFLYTVGMHPEHPELLVLDVPRSKVGACGNMLNTIIDGARAGTPPHANQFACSGGMVDSMIDSMFDANQLEGFKRLLTGNPKLAAMKDSMMVFCATEEVTDTARAFFQDTHTCQADPRSGLLLVKPVAVDRCAEQYATSWGSKRLAELMMSPAGMTLPSTCESIQMRVQRRCAGDPALGDDDCYVERGGESEFLCRELPSGLVLRIEAGSMLRGGLGTLHMDFDCSNNSTGNVKHVDEYAARAILVNYVEGTGHAPITFGMWPNIKHHSDKI